MKNQYAGDIGDYSKLGILRVILNAGFSLGVNWYLTFDDSKPDGRHIKYLEAPCNTPDKTLFDTLVDIVIKKNLRSVKELEDSGLLGDTVFYNEILDLSTGENRRQKRENWHKQAVSALCTQDIIFLDPDNGFETESISPYSTKGNKYVTYNETAEYFNKGATVIVYSHRDRSSEIQYVRRLLHIKNYISVAETDIFCIKAPRFSVRDYLFIMQPCHSKQIKKAMYEMFSTGWSKYLEYRNIIDGTHMADQSKGSYYPL